MIAGGIKASLLTDRLARISSFDRRWSAVLQSIRTEYASITFHGNKAPIPRILLAVLHVESLKDTLSGGCFVLDVPAADIPPSAST